MASGDSDSGTDGPAPSPCVGICRLDPDERYCLGCLRTLPEIAVWNKLDEPGRYALLDVLAARRAAGGDDATRA